MSIPLQVINICREIKKRSKICNENITTWEKKSAKKTKKKRHLYTVYINQNHQKSNKNKESSTNVAWEIVGECIIQPIEWAQPC